jgi:putative CocE/NonD family hydrolase
LTPSRRRIAPLLWFLLSLFVLRVLGQLAVFLGVGKFLPPMEEWYSGLLPYHLLLPAQILIIILLAKVCLDVMRGRGFFAEPRRRLGTGLLAFGSVYLGVMLIRYFLRMALYPAERWTGGSIPIFFHWVLATFLLVVGAFHRRGAAESPKAKSSWLVRAARAGVWGLVLLGVFAWVGYQLAPSLLAAKLGARRSEFAVRTEREALQTSDGIALVSDVYHPMRARDAATILVRLPLSQTVARRFFASTAARMWAERGYHVVIQVTRGRRPSGGRYDPLRHERSDGLETLTWLSRQQWFNGRLGMWGGSYFGYTQWVLADQDDPGPSCLMIQLCSTSFHGMFYPGGAFSLESALLWALVSRGEQDELPSRSELESGYSGFPVLDADERAGETIPFFDDWGAHRERDDYWARIDGEDRARTVKAPILLMAGWFDPFLPTQLEDFQTIRRSAPAGVSAATRLIIGPWAHARTVTLPGGFVSANYRFESLAPSVDWFDRFLATRPAGRKAETAPVRIFVMGRNEWRHEAEWPLARAIPTAYFLDSGGRANTAAGDGELRTDPAGVDRSDSYVYDPGNPVPSVGGTMLGPRAGVALQNAIEKRPDVLVYTSPVLERDLEVTGPIRLVLHVTTTAVGTDFTGKLVDVHANGAANNVSDGILRRRYAPEDAATEIEVELWPTSFVFSKGHRIRLEVSSSNYPRFDRNPNTGRAIATETRPIPARQTVHHGRSAPSRLILPVIPNPAGLSDPPAELGPEPTHPRAGARSVRR